MDTKKDAKQAENEEATRASEQEFVFLADLLLGLVALEIGDVRGGQQGLVAMEAMGQQFMAHQWASIIRFALARLTQPSATEVLALEQRANRDSPFFLSLLEKYG